VSDAGAQRGEVAETSPESSSTDEQVVESEAAPLPQRYVVRTDDGGRYLTCVAAQNVAVRIERGKTTPAATAKRADEGTIFLDGAAEGEPFLDVAQRVYNLDHHEGCIRAFTLATCEQAFVMVRKGLDLNAGEWTVHANEPDLDTVLAIWVLLNHQRLGDADAAVRRAILPILRLEGVIDAHGFGLIEICAFPDEWLDQTKRTLERIGAREKQLKSQGKWAQTDVLDYTAETLHAIDQVVFAPGQVEDLWSVEEIARVAITDERTAIVCRSDAGIYEVEEALRKQHPDRLGVIVLQKDRGTYTLRQSDSFLPISLAELYERLNAIDPAVRSTNRWGGSEEIGGSPRATGTSLSPQRVADVVRWVYRGPSLVQRSLALAWALAFVGGFIALAMGAAGLVGLVTGSAAPSTAPVTWLAGRPWYAGFLLSGTVLAYGLLALTNRRLYGAVLPRGWDWLWLLPAAVIAGLAGGAWLAPEWLGRGTAALPAALPFAAAAELLLRGIAHGRLTTGFRVAGGRGRWRLSAPAVLTGVLHGMLASVVAVPIYLALGGFAAVWRIGVTLLASTALGIALGVARERSESIVGPLLLHLVAAAAAAYGGLL
jgi:hypothetical protein